MATAAGQKPTAVEIQSNYQSILDYDGGSYPVYVGKAAPGTATSAASWAVYKIAYDGSNNPTSIKWASGTDAYDKVWDDRAGYNYS